MTFAAVIPALSVLSTLAGAASSAVSADGTENLDQMGSVFKRQQNMQLKTIELQTEANIQKMMADTANSIASGQLDSATKMQNAAHKAAQGIHF
ncbi:MAG TPA: hypothetical protein VGL01_03235 [Trinickia sp.]|uniref:hypothetical protein n=1 Tax=Trinickia sp. TaxID=2571163 RepID=UPI002F42C406